MKTEGVILAAGLSSRMGSNKLLLDIGDVPMIERVINNMLPFCERIIVVLGHAGHEIEPVLKKYDSVIVVYNDGYQSGMFSSIKVGCEHLEGDRFFLTPGDIPIVSSLTFQRLLGLDGEVVIPSYNGQAGHPILLMKNVIQGLGETEAQNLREYLEVFSKVYVNVCDTGILIDIDTTINYENLKAEGLI